MISVLSFFNLISTSLSLIFQILLLRMFGASLQTDIYYLSIRIIQFIPLIIGLLFPLDVYIPLYNEIKIKHGQKADEFAGAIFVVIFMLSLFFTFFTFIFSFWIVKIFATGFSYEKILFTSELLKILSISIIFHYLSGFLNLTLNANMYLKVPYFMNIVSPLFNILALLFFSKIYGIKALIYAITFSIIFNFFILFIYFLKKIPLRLTNPLLMKKEIFYLWKNSFLFKAGGIMWDLKIPITTNILSYFPAGYLTLFNYVSRILDIIYGIIHSPSIYVLYLKLSKYLPQNNIKEMKESIKSTLKANFFIFLISVFLFSLIFKNLFVLLFHPKVSISQIEIMYHLFILLIPFYCVMSFESPFCHVILCMKKGIKVFQVAVVFIILYSLSLLSFLKYLEIYALPLSLLIAQSYNAFSYSMFVNQELHLINKEMMKIALQFGIFVIFFIFFNNFFENIKILKFYFNLIWIVLLFLTMKREIRNVFGFLFRKGEIK